jgi:membrane fusion protein (multidrug efflux system)
MTESADTDTPTTSRRKPLITLILLLAAIAGGASAVWYFMQARWYATTENAYLTGNLVEVSAQIGGTVVWIGGETNEAVERGQQLLWLASGDQVQHLELRKNELALAVQDVLTLRAEVERLKGQVRLRVVTNQLAIEEFERRQRLFPKNMVSEEELHAAQTREEETRVALDTAQLALRKARVRAGDQSLHEHPQVMAASARLRSAYRDWRKTRVLSPVEGEIARRRVQAGQQVAAGKPLFSIAERHSAWIEANFKETQLRHIRPGQPVEIRTDLYGDDVILRGVVDSIGTGTGAIFSLLPPQNATGNWIKIVQRVPVRIEFEGGFDRNYPLPFGASLHVRVDTHDRSGPVLAAGPAREPISNADLYNYQDEGVEDLIAEVISTHGALPSHVPESPRHRRRM